MSDERSQRPGLESASKKYLHTDLPDSPHDAERLQPEETTIELPDVSDIPGQEHVHAPPLGILADTTISSADEEGEGLFGDDEDEDDDFRSTGDESDVNAEEAADLQHADETMPTQDEERLQRASIDSTDEDGDPLNEAGFGGERTGEDLDIPGRLPATNRDAMGQGDEENSHYSIGGDKDDANEEGKTV